MHVVIMLVSLINIKLYFYNSNCKIYTFCIQFLINKLSVYTIKIHPLQSLDTNWNNDSKLTSICRVGIYEDFAHRYNVRDFSNKLYGTP